MVAPGGPDDETWKKMSPAAKRAYWIVTTAIVALIFGLFIWHIFNPIKP